MESEFRGTGLEYGIVFRAVHYACIQQHRNIRLSAVTPLRIHLNLSATRLLHFVL